MDNPAFQRHIKSFVLRQGHLSPAQQRALDTLYPQFGIDYTGQPLDVITRDTERDNYMTAQQAKEYGLIDDILYKH